MERHDAAELLGISVSASKREVRSAFRRRVRADHPDNAGDGTADLARLAKARDRMLAPSVAAKRPSPQTVASDSVYSVKPKPARPTTLTYGYEKYTEPEREQFRSRTPSGHTGAAKPGTLGSISRIPKANIAMLFIVAIFATLIVINMLRAA